MSLLTRKRKPETTTANDELRVGHKFVWSEPGSTHLNQDTTIVAVRWNEAESKDQHRRVATVLVVDAVEHEGDDKYARLDVLPNEDGSVWTVQYAQWFFGIKAAVADWYVD